MERARILLNGRYYPRQRTEKDSFVIEMLGDRLAWVVWNDGREHKMPLEYIRDECYKITKS